MHHIRQLQSDVNLREEDELRRLESGCPGGWAGDDDPWDEEAELAIEAQIAQEEEEEELVLLSDDEDEPPAAAPAKPAGPPSVARAAPKPLHQPAGPRQPAAAPKPAPAPTAAAGGGGGERAEVETFSGLRLRGGRALGAQALRALFEQRGCRVLTLANVRAHASATGPWATVGMLVRCSSRDSGGAGDGGGRGGGGTCSRGTGGGAGEGGGMTWLLSDLDPDMPTVMRLY